MKRILICAAGLLGMVAAYSQTKYPESSYDVSCFRQTGIHRVVHERERDGGVIRLSASEIVFTEGRLNLDEQVLRYSVYDASGKTPGLKIWPAERPDIILTIGEERLVLEYGGRELSYGMLTESELPEVESMILYLFSSVYELLRKQKFREGILFEEAPVPVRSVLEKGRARISRVVCVRFGGTYALAQYRTKSCADTYGINNEDCELVGIDTNCLGLSRMGLCVSTASFDCDPKVLFLFGPWGAVPVYY